MTVLAAPSVDRASDIAAGTTRFVFAADRAREFELCAGHVKVHTDAGRRVYTAPARVTIEAGEDFLIEALIDSTWRESPPMRERVEALQRRMLERPQAATETRHYYADGMYAREVARPKDCLIVGKVHRREHFYIVTKGRVRVTTDDGVQDIEAPAVLVCKPGTKRAVLALEDSVCMTVHQNPTGSEDLEEIEDALVEPDPTSPFIAGNRLKELP